MVQTNLLGTLLCTRAAMQALAAQKKGGHIFNMDGAGANNLPSPMYAAYGATKAGRKRSLSPEQKLCVGSAQRELTKQGIPGSLCVCPHQHDMRAMLPSAAALVYAIVWAVMRQSRLR